MTLLRFAIPTSADRMSARASATSLCVWLPLFLATYACSGGDDPPPDNASWYVVQQNLPGALMSLWGTAPDDVWAVGADTDDGQGPTILHFDGAMWERRSAGITGDLWWVHGFPGGPVYMGGTSGQIVHYQDGVFTPMATPGTGVVFGIWGTGPDDMWAVGGAAGGGRGAFAWRLVADEWVPAPDFPVELADNAAVWKVNGRATDDVWLVGTSGLGVHWDGSTFTQDNLPTGESVFTVHSNAERFVAVGGFGTGRVFINDGSGWVDDSPQAIDPLIGVYVGDSETYAVGEFGAVMRRGAETWEYEPTGTGVFESLHAVWIDPDGGVWAVGGQVQSNPLIRGVLLYRGENAPGEM